MKRLLLVFLWACLASPVTFSDFPRVLNYQGRIQVGGQNFEGEGQFKFALVTADGLTVWSNDGTGVFHYDSQPTASVRLPVSKGLYSVLLGDSGMSPLTRDAFAMFTEFEGLYLRIWFSSGPSGFQLLTPDHRIGAVGYSLLAADAETLDGINSSFFLEKLDDLKSDITNSTNALEGRILTRIEAEKVARETRDGVLQGQINTLNTTAAGLQNQISGLATGSGALQYSQHFAPVFSASGDTKTVDEISVVVPGAGFLFISATANCKVFPRVFPGGGGIVDLAFVLYDATSAQVELARCVTHEFGPPPTNGGEYIRRTAMISWVMPVTSAGTVRLRTQSVLVDGTDMVTQEHNLTAIYIPRLAQ